MKKIPYLFIFSFIVYLGIGFGFSLHTRLVYHPDYICDLFLGFDNLMHQTSSFRHPMLSFFPRLGQWMSSQWNTTLLSIGITVLTSFILAVQNSLVYRFNVEILKLSSAYALLGSVFFASFSANLINIIAFDSFVFSSLLSVLVLYFYFKKQKKLFYIVAFLQIGTTISQFFKILYLTIRQKFSGKIALLVTASVLTGTYGLFLLLQNQYHFLHIIQYHQRVTDIPTLMENFYSLMIGGVFLLPELVVQKAMYLDKSFHDIVIGSSRGIFRNALIFLLLVFSILSIYKNRKNKIVRVSIPLFLMDIFIHILLGYGNQELYLFSSHYQFVFYILLALLIKNYATKPWLKPVFIGVVMMLLTSNIHKLYLLYEFGLAYYPLK